MECRYREKNYCIYSNRNCNPRNISCVKYHKTKTTAAVTYTANTSKISAKIKTNILFPSVYAKTVRCKKKTTVYIYGGTLTAQKNQLLDYKIIVNDILDKSKVYPLYVVYNTKTQKYYMGEQVLQYYIKKNYHPNIIFKYANASECSDPFSSQSTNDLSIISVLKMYGYTVGKSSGLSQIQRQEILAFVLDHKLMKGYEIINLLQFNIATRKRQKKFQEAVSDWKMDVAFVTKYMTR